jgi:oligosaccharide repeat unit polymerase
MLLRLNSIQRLNFRLQSKVSIVTRTAEIAGWLFLFGVGGMVYWAAQTNGTWIWVSAFVATIFLVITLGTLWEWLLTRRSPVNARNAIFIGVLFWLLLDPLVMREGIDEFSPEVVLRALLYAGIFLAALCVGYIVPAYPGVKRFFSHMPANTNDNRGFWLTFAIYLCGVIPFVYIAGGSLTEFSRLLLAGYSPDVEVGWRRGMLGDEQAFLKSFARLLHLTVPFLGTYLVRRPLAVWKKVLLAMMTASLWMLIFFSGERRVLAFIVLGPLLYVFFITTKKTRKKWAPVFVVAVLALFWAMQAQVQFRAGGFYDFNASVIETNPIEMHRDNNFYWFATAVNTMPSAYNFTDEWVFVQVFTHPIPRFLWPGKPYSSGFPFVQWEEMGASLTISVVGELYVGQGVLGILVGGLIYGWIAKCWDQLLGFLDKGYQINLIYSLGLTLLLLSVRSFGDLVVNWYVLVIVVLALRYVGLRRKSNHGFGFVQQGRFGRSGATV